MELTILDMIQLIRTPFGDVVMPLITKLGNAGLVWIVLAAVLLIIPKTRKTGFIIAAALLFDLLICNGILKPLIARVRPFDVNQAIQLLVAKPKDYSFPSGHSAAAFATTAALLFAGKKKAGWAVCILACLIAFSRLYLYLHYPTDVLGGIAVGILCGFLGNLIVNKVETKIPGHS